MPIQPVENQRASSALQLCDAPRKMGKYVVEKIGSLEPRAMVGAAMDIATTPKVLLVAAVTNLPAAAANIVCWLGCMAPCTAVTWGGLTPFCAAACLGLCNPPK